MLDTRAERTSDLDFYDAHGITHRQFLVPDVTVPDAAVLTDAVAWIDDQLADDRTVLIHCAKGRGRSATVLAAYLMKTRGHDASTRCATCCARSERWSSSRTGTAGCWSRGSPPRATRTEHRVDGAEQDRGLERETGFEPATSSLEGWRSTN